MHLKIEGTLPKLTVWPQWLASAGVTVILILLGLMGGWTSPYLAKLTAEDSPIRITMEEASWVASIFNLSRIMGAILGAISVEYFGSKRTLLICGVPIALNWISNIFADSVIWLYVARYLGGTGAGMTFSSFPLYLGEISDPSIRGSLVTLALSGYALGNLFGNLMGAYMDMTHFALIALVPNIIILILFLWLPESPHYLVRHDKTENAKRSILWYHREADIKAEVESLKQFVRTSSELSVMDKLREFNIPRNRMAGILIIMLFMFMQFSGLNSIVFYMEIILTKGKVSVLPPATMVVILGPLGICSGFITMHFVDKCPRRTLVLASTVGVGISMIGLGVHFMLLEHDYDSDRLQWLIIASLAMFQVTLCFGLVPIPSIVLSELFAPNIKSLAACLASIAIGLFAFMSTKSYQSLVDTIGEPYVFWTNAMIMLLIAVPCIAFMMPETKGKSLQEIQDLLMRNSIVKSQKKTRKNGV